MGLFMHGGLYALSAESNEWIYGHSAGRFCQPWNHRVKPAAAILPTYRAVAAQQAVFLPNVGPRPFGDIHPEEQQVLRRLGQAIRGETGG
jgi:hypothetical protein